MPKSFHSCADVFMGQSPRNGVAGSEDKCISTSVNYFQISLQRVTLLCPPRDVQECLLSPSFVMEYNVKLLNFCYE